MMEEVEEEEEKNVKRLCHHRFLRFFRRAERCDCNIAPTISEMILLELYWIQRFSTSEFNKKQTSFNMFSSTSHGLFSAVKR